MMIERGGDGSGDIQKMQQYAGHIIEYHAQYADRTVATFNASLAAFLVGAGPNAFFGAGGGWGGPGPDGCASWLEDRAEYHKALGEPLGDGKEDPPGVFTRAFKSGTHVKHQPQVGMNGKEHASCIWWADGTTTGNAC
eukprot:g1262.t1